VIGGLKSVQSGLGIRVIRGFLLKQFPMRLLGSTAVFRFIRAIRGQKKQPINSHQGTKAQKNPQPPFRPLCLGALV
jgi:hypothetical protein